MCAVPAQHTQCPECDLQHCQKKIVQVVSGVCNVFVMDGNTVFLESMNLDNWTCYSLGLCMSFLVLME